MTNPTLRPDCLSASASNSHAVLAAQIVAHRQALVDLLDAVEFTQKTLHSVDRLYIALPRLEAAKTHARSVLGMP